MKSNQIKEPKCLKKVVLGITTSQNPLVNVYNFQVYFRNKNCLPTVDVQLTLHSGDKKTDYMYKKNDREEKKKKNKNLLLIPLK